MNERCTVVVTDAQWRKSLSAIRSLGKAGHEVICVGESLFSMGFYSRYARRHIKAPPPSRAPGRFLRALEKAVATASCERVVLLPMEDETCAWVLENGEKLPSELRTLLPSKDAFALASNKATTAEFAARCGVPCPETFVCKTAEELGKLAKTKPIGNFIVKPCRGSGSAGLLYGEQILSTDIEAHWRQHGPLILQERIPSEGPAFGVSFLFDSAGNLAAAFEHKRLKEYPVSGGPSTQRISVPLDDLFEHSRKILEALSWRGVAMVEWKRHPHTGKPALIEINPRFWGSLALAAASGMDFPSLCVEAACGRATAEPLLRYKTGVVSRWVIPGDILRFLGAKTGTRESLVDFVRACFREAEELDSSDLRGSLAAVVCQGLLALKPKYWKFLRRR